VCASGSPRSRQCRATKIVDQPLRVASKPQFCGQCEQVAGVLHRAKSPDFYANSARREPSVWADARLTHEIAKQEGMDAALSHSCRTSAARHQSSPPSRKYEARQGAARLEYSQILRPRGYMVGTWRLRESGDRQQNQPGRRDVKELRRSCSPTPSWINSHSICPPKDLGVNRGI
jgi:hypothetical protein